MTEQELKLFIKKQRLEEIEKSKKELLQELTGIAGQLKQTKAVLGHTMNGYSCKSCEKEIKKQDTNSQTDIIKGAVFQETVAEETDEINQKQDQQDQAENGMEEYTEPVPCVRKANKVVIGIAGSQQRIGCTHACIMLGSFLRKFGFKAALLEYGRSDALESITDVRGSGFDLYGNVTAESLLHILSSKFYNFLLIDYGLYEECDQLMYNRSDIRILLSGAKEWETKNVNRIFENTELETLRQMTFLFNFVAGTQQKVVRREMAELGVPYFLPLLADPFSADTEKIGEIRMLFREYMEEQPENKWKKLLKRGSVWKD